jgi:hypothetical protein
MPAPASSPGGQKTSRQYTARFCQRGSVLQVPGRSSQIIEFDLQLADHHLEPIQLDPLESLHPFLKPVLQAGEDLGRGQLAGGP